MGSVGDAVCHSPCSDPVPNAQVPQSASSASAIASRFHAALEADVMLTAETTYCPRQPMWPMLRLSIATVHLPTLTAGRATSKNRKESESDARWGYNNQDDGQTTREQT